ncbi:tRNA (adenosine(37)-N6)-threonylcarbamoyltransferase complex dimerization subunit type 1 TsaB [Candidatus Aerophobetes bacterium]|nr:tRNA (adenosine(37)-N6)-threonylcarbamoyltransferase complex dimerization subunit type 1 TsaB [Candidatus Aerophobetes bacterium]
MLILGIETALPTGIVFLSKKEEILASCSIPSFSSSKHLLPAIDEIFKRTGISLKKLSVISVSKGPGSFTGIRIGISLAKSLSFCLNTHLIGIPTLDLIASSLPLSGFVCSLIPAYRNSFFSAFFYKEGENIKRLTDYLFLTPEKLLVEAEKLTEKKIILVIYPESHLPQVNFKEKFSIFKEKFTLDKPLLKLTLDYIRKKKIDDPLNLTPIYVSPPIIHRQEGNKNASGK